MFFGLIFKSVGGCFSSGQSERGGFEMSRIFGLVMGLSLFMAASAGQAWALAGVDGVRVMGAPHQSLIVRTHATKGKPVTEKQKCLALNRCRYKYTVCYDKLVSYHKNIERHKIECVKPYQKCINASFSGFDFFLTRWFNPEADCNNF
jgi:hypothetical protein